MIRGLEEYETYIRKILKKVPLMRTEQMETMLMKTFEGTDRTLAGQILTAVQRRGYLLLSEDGWLMTKGIYVQLSGDTFYDELLPQGQCRLPEMDALCRDFRRGQTELMWLIADLAPMSNDFLMSCGVWDAAFITEDEEEKEAKIYELIWIPGRLERVKCELLRTLPEVKDPADRRLIVRIAVMENGVHAYKVPYKGIRYIVEPDGSARHYRIAEKRTGEEVWQDETAV